MELPDQITFLESDQKLVGVNVKMNLEYQALEENQMIKLQDHF